MTIDDLLHGEERGVYRIGRRSDDPQHGSSTPDPARRRTPHIDLVHLGAARDRRARRRRAQGSGIIAVASGLVQLTVAGQTPALRHGEVLVADASQVARLAQPRQSEAVLFWIVIP